MNSKCSSSRLGATSCLSRIEAYDRSRRVGHSSTTGTLMRSLRRLMKVMSGETKRLIINLPPRSLKSLMASVLFPAFWLGHDPRKKIFGISYGGDLAAKHARDCQLVMQSNWYRATFPGTRISRIADLSIYTHKQGFRKATSISATLTGLGGDCFIIDDPLKPIDAQSEPGFELCQ